MALVFTALLGLAACNNSGGAAKQDFNAAGQNLGNGNVGAGANDTGHGFSNGANATGQAIGDTAHRIGQSSSTSQ
jgi:hypothetical protein